jgi:hypothetical protein
LMSTKRCTKNLQLVTWISGSLLALLVTLLLPAVSLSGFFFRWILLLTYPLAFFAADAFSRPRLRFYKVASSLIIVLLSASFLMFQGGFVSLYFSSYSNYVPTSMIQNTVPLSDCRDTVNALEWVKTNYGNGSLLLVHDAFVGWAYLSLKPDTLISYGYGDPSVRAYELRKSGLNCSLLLIWWVDGSGLHGQPSVPSSFVEVFESGRIGVFRYSSTHEEKISIQK